MEKSLFKISKMDCPSEENLIRIALQPIKTIAHLDFDIANRNLTVFHKGDLATIEKSINALNLDSSLISSTPTTDEKFESAENQKKLLWAVLAINFGFFVIEMTTGLIAKSMGLVADSLDMLADSLVYGMSLFAVGAATIRKKKIATTAGYFQVALAFIGLVEIVRRFAGIETMPEFKFMIIVSAFALLANSLCLYLLQKSKSREAHMQASMIFTSNDVIINLGVILAGVLVHYLHSGIPDLIVGLVVFILVIRGAMRILKLGK